MPLMPNNQENDAAQVRVLQTRIYNRFNELFRSIRNTDDPILLMLMAEEVELLDFQLQRLRGFQPLKNMHVMWLRIEKCTCDKVLGRHNAQNNLPRVVNPQCPLHRNMHVEQPIAQEPAQAPEENLEDIRRREIALDLDNLDDGHRRLRARQQHL